MVPIAGSHSVLPDAGGYSSYHSLAIAPPLLHAQLCSPRAHHTHARQCRQGSSRACVPLLSPNIPYPYTMLLLTESHKFSHRCCRLLTQLSYLHYNNSSDLPALKLPSTPCSPPSVLKRARASGSLNKAAPEQCRQMTASATAACDSHTLQVCTC